MRLHAKHIAIILLQLVAFVFIASCNNSGNTYSNGTPDKDASAGDNTERQQIVEELSKLRAVLESRDKEKIAGIFNFPLSDSIQIYAESESYQEELKTSGGKVTKKLFLKYFREISDDIHMEQVTQLFNHIKYMDLIKQDTLKYKNLKAAEPCYDFYSIEIKNNFVTLSVGSGSNENYKSNASGDEVPENSSEFCESVLWWVFKYDKNKFRLVSINGAG